MTTPLGLPSFHAYEKVDTFATRLELLLKNHLKQIDSLLQENPHYTWDNLMSPLEDMADELERFWSPLAHLHSVMDTRALRDCYDACLPLLSAYEAAIGHNRLLYEAIVSIKNKDLNSIQQKIKADQIRDFQLSGVALSKEQKNRFEAIQKRLAELSNQFGNNVLDATQAFTLHITNPDRLAGLPDHALQTAKKLATEKGLSGHLLTLEFPCYQAVITYAKDRALREELYQAYLTRASDQGPHAGTFDNTALMHEMLALRHEKAQLLGFSDYAELSLATKMAESSKQVLDFMQDLASKARLQAQNEWNQLKQFANQEWHLNPVQPWDIAYLSEKRRQHLYTLSQEDLRPYFPQPQVMQGLFDLVKQLYGITIEIVEGVEVWHPDVQCYCAVDENNKIRGFVYTDLYARPNKRGGAWMDSLQSRRTLENGQIQPPIATLTCNFAHSSTDKSPILSHEEVITLFHEFGHCLHHILTQVDYLSAAGINGVEWDAVELPSQFFENWCWEKEALFLLSSHTETGERLPDSLLERLIEAKNFQAAMGILRQMEFSLFDFCLHKQYKGYHESLMQDLLAEIRTQTNVLPVAPYNRFTHSFNHIFNGGYAAGYYSYIWAEVLSSDAFSRFEEEGILNQKTGQDFLKCILEVGGSKKASEAYKDFRGQAATVDALLRHNGIQ